MNIKRTAIVGIVTCVGCGNESSLGSFSEIGRASDEWSEVSQPDSDYAGDGRDDLVYIDPSGGNARWFRRIDGLPTVDEMLQFGTATDTFVPGDYDGNGKTEQALFRPETNEWHIVNQAPVVFGEATDRLVPGKYDSDGKTDIAVFRPSNGTWYVRKSTGGADIVVQFGEYTDIPVPGDYTGDGRTDFAVFRPNNGTWYVRPSSGGPDLTPVQFGEATDRLVPGDYDGDQRADLAVFRPRDNTWYVRRSGGGVDLVVSDVGTATDRQVPGNYDNDNKTDMAYYRPSDHRWFAKLSTGGTLTALSFGVARAVIPYAVLEPRQPGCPSHHDVPAMRCHWLLWPNGKINYEIDSSIPAGTAAHSQIMQAMTEWESATGGRIDFVPNVVVPRVRFKAVLGASASCQPYDEGKTSSGGIVTGEISECVIGRNPDGTPAPAGLLTTRHEVGHAIGLFHEQLRADRDRHVVVDDSAFTCGDNYSANWWKCGPDDPNSDLGPYDLQGTMQYRSVPPNYIWHQDGTDHGREPSIQVNEPLRGQFPNTPVRAYEGSKARELYATQYGWRKFKNIGFDVSSTRPLSEYVAPGVLMQGSPALAAEGGAGALHAFVRGTDDKIYWRARNGGAWGNAVALGGTASTDPAATSMGPGTAIVALRSGNTLQAKEFAGGTWAASWTTLTGPGGSLCSAPSLASSGTSNTRIYVRACDGKIYRSSRVSAGNWTAFTALGLAPAGVAFNGKPAVVARGSFFDVFTNSSSGRIYHSSNGTTWTERACCLPTNASPAAAVSPFGRIDVAFRGTDQDAWWIYRDTATSAWSGPLAIGGVVGRHSGGSVIGDLAIASAFNDHLDALAILTDGNLWHRTYDRAKRFLSHNYFWDNRADFVVFRPSQRKWLSLSVRKAVAPQAGQIDEINTRELVLGVFGDQSLVPGDYDGDGYTDAALFVHADRRWRVKATSTGLETEVASTALASDRFVPGDYNGDGKTDYAYYRPSLGNWVIKTSAGGSETTLQFGASGDIPVPADYDGDGRTDHAVFRPSTGTWFVHPSTGGFDLTMIFGVASDRLVPADYDGDGKTDHAVFRPSEGKWYVRPSGGGADIVTQFGVSTDVLVPADYDWDGKADIAVYRPSSRIWFVRLSAGGPDLVHPHGDVGDVIPYGK